MKSLDLDPPIDLEELYRGVDKYYNVKDVERARAQGSDTRNSEGGIGREERNRYMRSKQRGSLSWNDLRGCSHLRRFKKFTYLNSSRVNLFNKI